MTAQIRYAEVRVESEEQIDELVRLAALADIGLTVYDRGERPCTCDGDRECPACFDGAEALVGKRIRDSYGREWVVTEVGEKDGYPTIGCYLYWARPDEVTVLERWLAYEVHPLDGDEPVSVLVPSVGFAPLVHEVGAPLTPARVVWLEVDDG